MFMGDSSDVSMQRARGIGRYLRDTFVGCKWSAVYDTVIICDLCVPSTTGDDTMTLHAESADSDVTRDSNADNDDSIRCDAIVCDTTVMMTMPMERTGRMRSWDMPK